MTYLANRVVPGDRLDSPPDFRKVYEMTEKTTKADAAITMEIAEFVLTKTRRKRRLQKWIDKLRTHLATVPEESSRVQHDCDTNQIVAGITHEVASRTNDPSQSQFIPEKLTSAVMARHEIDVNCLSRWRFDDAPELLQVLAEDIPGTIDFVHYVPDIWEHNADFLGRCVLLTIKTEFGAVHYT